MVKPFVDAEPQTEGRLHKEQHRSFTPAKKHCSSCHTSIPFQKKFENQAMSYRVRVHIPNEMAAVDTLNKEKSEPSVLFGHSFLCTVSHDSSFVECFVSVLNNYDKSFVLSLTCYCLNCP